MIGTSGPASPHRVAVTRIHQQDTGLRVEEHEGEPLDGKPGVDGDECLACLERGEHGHRRGWPVTDDQPDGVATVGHRGLDGASEPVGGCVQLRVREAPVTRLDCRAPGVQAHYVGEACRMEP